MFQEFKFEDIIFGVFPKVGAVVSDVYGTWAKNSVGDIVEILMQMLEVRFFVCLTAPAMYFNIYTQGLAFIHQQNIAHRVSIFLHKEGRL